MELKLVINHKEYFESSYENNYETYKSYLDYQPVIFMELAFNIGEIVRCLIIEANTASITMTNFMLERLLKLALIEDEMQLGPLTHPWEECWERMHPYFDFDLNKTINQCARKQLISGKQKKELHRYREIFRNGFSHASTDLIFKEHPETFTTPYYDDTVTHNLKKDPRYQLSFLQKIAKDNAHKYFKYVFELIANIEENLQKKHPGKLVLIKTKEGGVLRLSAKGWSPKVEMDFSLNKNDENNIKLAEKLLEMFNAKFEKNIEDELFNYKVVFYKMEDFENYKTAVKTIYNVDLERA